jgi:hypothetical protein
MLTVLEVHRVVACPIGAGHAEPYCDLDAGGDGVKQKLLWRIADFSRGESCWHDTRRGVKHARQMRVVVVE